MDETHFMQVSNALCKLNTYLQDTAQSKLSCREFFRVVKEVPNTTSKHLHGKTQEPVVVSFRLDNFSLKRLWLCRLFPVIVEVGKPVGPPRVLFDVFEYLELAGIDVALFLFYKLDYNDRAHDWTFPVVHRILQLLLFPVEGEDLGLEDPSHASFS